MNNLSDKLIDSQGDVGTYSSGTDARLFYKNGDGELKKYLIEGEGGGGGTDTPSALFDPELEYNYVDTSYEDYVNTVTITTKRAGSDESIFKLVDLVDNSPVNVITVNNESSGTQVNFNGNATFNNTAFYIKEGNNYRFKSETSEKYDEDPGSVSYARDFELTAGAALSEAKIYTDMYNEAGKFEIIFGVNTGVSDVTKREFILRFINDGVNENLDFKIVARVTKVEDDQETVNETAVFTASIMDDGSIINS